nr:AfsR/SARP family transcriptional regulator [Micromonospora sp. DSM 115978]
LVLDNCEHLLDAAATVASAVLAGCPSVRLLVTSRERLGIDGERLLPVDPLPLPPAGASWPEALRYPSVRLFADRAEAVRPGTTPTGHEADAVVEICRRLDGLPLALELAAARLRHRSAVEIAARLDDRFRLLTGGSRTALPRHQTLHAVVSWSWDLLDDAERAMLRRLSVTAGATTATAAAAVFGAAHGSDVRAVDVLDLLDALVDKSLLVAVWDGDQSDGTRYRMLDTVQAFARDKLAAAGGDEREAARQAHAAFFVDLAERAEPQLRGADQLVWIRRLRADHENLLVALRWALDESRYDEAVRLGAAMGWLWWIEGHHLT